MSRSEFKLRADAAEFVPGQAIIVSESENPSQASENSNSVGSRSTQPKRGKSNARGRSRGRGRGRGKRSSEGKQEGKSTGEVAPVVRPRERTTRPKRSTERGRSNKSKQWRISGNSKQERKQEHPVSNLPLNPNPVMIKDLGTQTAPASANASTQHVISPLARDTKDLVLSLKQERLKAFESMHGKAAVELKTVNSTTTTATETGSNDSKSNKKQSELLRELSPDWSSKLYTIEYLNKAAEAAESVETKAPDEQQQLTLNDAFQSTATNQPKSDLERKLLSPTWMPVLDFQHAKHDLTKFRQASAPNSVEKQPSDSSAYSFELWQALVQTGSAKVVSFLKALSAGSKLKDANEAKMQAYKVLLDQALTMNIAGCDSQGFNAVHWSAAMGHANILSALLAFKLHDAENENAVAEAKPKLNEQPGAASEAPSKSTSKPQDLGESLWASARNTDWKDAESKDDVASESYIEQQQDDAQASDDEQPENENETEEIDAIGRPSKLSSVPFLVSTKSQLRLTACHLAALCGHVECLQILLKHGSKQGRDVKGNLPIHYAALANHTDCLTALVKHEPSSLTKKNRDGHTALALACLAGKEQAVKTIMNSVGKRTVHSVNKKSQTCLHLAVQFPDILAILLAGHANANIVDGDGNSALMLCLRHRPVLFESAQMLLSKGAVPNAWNSLQPRKTNKSASLIPPTKRRASCGPLHLAATAADVRACALLLKYGAEINAEDNSQHNTPLHRAVIAGHLPLVEFLLHQKRVVVDAPNSRDETALLLAASAGNTECCGLLLKRRAAIEAQDKKSRTPLSVASFCGHLETAAFLIRHGAQPSLAVVKVFTDKQAKHESSAAVVQHLGLLGLLNQNVFSDVKFLVEEETVYAHRCVLAARSEYFHAMLCGRSAEAASSTVTLENIRLPVFQLVLRYLYCGTLSTAIDCTLLFELIIAANEFLLPELIRLCSLVAKSNHYLLPGDATAASLTFTSIQGARRVQSMFRGHMGKDFKPILPSTWKNAESNSNHPNSSLQNEDSEEKQADISDYLRYSSQQRHVKEPRLMFDNSLLKLLKSGLLADVSLASSGLDDSKNANAACERKSKPDVGAQGSSFSNIQARTSGSTSNNRNTSESAPEAKGLDEDEELFQTGSVPSSFAMTACLGPQVSNIHPTVHAMRVHSCILAAHSSTIRHLSASIAESRQDTVSRSPFITATAHTNAADLKDNAVIHLPDAKTSSETCYSAKSALISHPARIHLDLSPRLLSIFVRYIYGGATALSNLTLIEVDGTVIPEYTAQFAGKQANVRTPNPDDEPVTVADIQQLMSAATLYLDNAKALHQILGELLVSHISLESALATLEAAKQANSPYLLYGAACFIVMNFRAIVATEAFKARIATPSQQKDEAHTAESKTDKLDDGKSSNKSSKASAGSLPGDTTRSEPLQSTSAAAAQELLLDLVKLATKQ